MAKKIRLDRRIGMLCLSAWLILQGLASAIQLHFAGFGVLLGVLAIAAGLLLLVDR
jgi:hypothetical protein